LVIEFLAQPSDSVIYCDIAHVISLRIIVIIYQLYGSARPGPVTWQDSLT